MDTINIDIRCPKCGEYSTTDVFDRFAITASGIKEVVCPVCERSFGVSLHAKYYQYELIPIREGE